MNLDVAANDTSTKGILMVDNNCTEEYNISTVATASKRSYLMEHIDSPYGNHHSIEYSLKDKHIKTGLNEPYDLKNIDNWLNITQCDRLLNNFEFGVEFNSERADFGLYSQFKD